MAVETVQDMVPIVAVHEKLNLIQSYEGQFSRSYRIGEANYQTLAEDQQAIFFDRWRSFLNSLGSNSEIAVTVFNRNINMEAFCDAVMTKETGDNLDYLRKQYNKIILDRIMGGRNGIETNKYLTISIHESDADKAASVFNGRIDMDVNTQMNSLGSSAQVVGIEDRLEVLHDIYNPGHEGAFLTKFKTTSFDGDGVSVKTVSSFDFENVRRMGISINDVISPSSLAFYNNYFEIGDYYARALRITTYPSTLSDEFFSSLYSVHFNLLTTVNIKPMTNADADKAVGLQLTLIRKEKDDAQKRAIKNGSDPNMISPAIEEREQEAIDLRNDMRQHDEHLFNTTVTVIIFAKTMAELDKNTEFIKSDCRKRSVVISTMTGQQEEGLISTLPLCNNLIKQTRTFKSSSIAMFLPFSVMELSDRDGINYSCNAITKNLILYDRTKQSSFNGFIFGIPGSGKSFMAKYEMLSVILNSGSDVIVIDPEAEYHGLCEALNGTIIKVEAGGKDMINPMDIYVDSFSKSEGDPIREKVDFVINLFRFIIKSTFGLNAVQRNIIDECVTSLYRPYYITKRITESQLQPGDIACTHELNDPNNVISEYKGLKQDGSPMWRFCKLPTVEALDSLTPEFNYFYHVTNVLAPIPVDQSPTLTDLLMLFKFRPEMEARELYYALKNYSSFGSLSTFSGRTTIDINNRFVVFDIQSLGDEMKPVAMHILLNTIWQRIVQNRSLGKMTYFYVDEIYLLFRDEDSAKYLQMIYKRARKYGGVPTGITQNIEDLLNSDTARTMLSNSLFTVILNQSANDREHIKEKFNLSDAQCDFITNAPSGQGLIYTGTQIVPFSAEFPKDNDIYRLLTSNMKEIQQYEQEKKRKELEEHENQQEAEAVQPETTVL